MGWFYIIWVLITLATNPALKGKLDHPMLVGSGSFLVQSPYDTQTEGNGRHRKPNIRTDGERRTSAINPPCTRR